MSKSTIQNWNAKSQIRNPKCQGVMQFLVYIVESIMQNTRRSDSLQCRIEIRDPMSKSKSRIRNAKCQGAMQFSNSECKMSRRNAVL